MIETIQLTAMHISPYINLFFTFSFLGWVMECIVIRREKGAWEKRGFVHAPFCIIYGFGAMLGYMLLQPIAHNYVLLYIVGAISATIFEYLTALLMLRIFGEFWWDYTNKPFNYKGIICLESTLAWGVVALLVLGFLHDFLLQRLLYIPAQFSNILAVVLVVGYSVDFIISAVAARKEHNNNRNGSELEA